ncbi:unnamed protein product [Notodromas monacha]|uniref:Apolipoprotein D n=1 Tax=Notodromas monacha TaxID=399045 RepID=A0A7R9BG68_9CRUS|nr:unnamed protein product [Notodromas monacha]CAG0914687.1 unnamed protein product [Notodromas monacha]
MSCNPVILFVALLCAFVVDGHEWVTGVCPSSVPYMPNFDIEKFTGSWFVKRKTGTYSSCLKNRYFFTKGEWRVVESRDWLPLDAIGVQSNLEHEGYLSVPDASPAKMRLNAFTDVAGKGDYVVVDTDYENYAVIFECQNIANLLGLGVSRRSGAILTRDVDWNNPEAMHKAQEELTPLGVKTDEVSHVGCEKPNFQVTVDKDLMENVSNAVGQAIGTAYNSVEGVIRQGVDMFTEAPKVTNAASTESNAIPGDRELLSEVVDLRSGTPSTIEKVVRQNDP